MKPVGTSKCENHFSSNTASLNCKRNRENTKLNEALGFSKFYRKETVASMAIGLRCNILGSETKLLITIQQTPCVLMYFCQMHVTLCYIP